MVKSHLQGHVTEHLHALQHLVSRRAACTQVWSVVPLPDGSGFVSCSADHSVKFWEWEILSAGAVGSAGQAPASRRLSARHARTLKMADDVLCIRISPDGRLIAAALLDSTIQACHYGTVTLH